MFDFDFDFTPFYMTSSFRLLSSLTYSYLFFVTFYIMALSIVNSIGKNIFNKNVGGGYITSCAKSDV
jgi:hypothetical protein